MGATLWSGLLTAERYALACPSCGNNTARIDCDSLGRTIVLCDCRREPFLMPLTIGGHGSAWPIDLSAALATPDDHRPRVSRKGKLRDPDARRCRWEDEGGCERAVGPRSNYCGVHSRLAAARRFPCSEPGCPNLRSARAMRCTECTRQWRISEGARAREMRRRQRAEQPRPPRRRVRLELGRGFAS
jgi:hypothetical protein